MDRRGFLQTLPPLLLPVCALRAAEPPELVFDGTSGEAIRALHGVNGGPLAAGGLLDLSDRWKEAAFPLTRLHDCHWPNPDVVDMHAVFPNPVADPARPESYDFERTDEYLKAVHDCGARIVYRLGESIEHQKAKRNARPPKDPDLWAAACVGIVNHYTKGWAQGFRYAIDHWEIWNEPDNRPNCWTGTDDEYFRLYTATAIALRKQFPVLKIGGPGLGNSGEWHGDRFEPTPFLKAFLARCRKDDAPLDFLSWHCYSGAAAELVRRAKGVPAVLDAAGFQAAESHLNEWNFLPGGDWKGMAARDAGVREKWYARLNGAEGAAFVASALALLQDAPVDVACYFTAEAPGMGLFSPHGLPSKTFHAIRAFKALAGLKRLPMRNEAPPGVSALAGAGKDVWVLLARSGETGGPVTITVRPARWVGATRYEVRTVDADRESDKPTAGTAAGSTIRVDVPAPAVCLVRMREEKT